MAYARQPRRGAGRGPGVVAVAGHFGEWLQGRQGPQGPVVLVTVACDALRVTAKRLDHGPLALEQDAPLLATVRAAELLRLLGAAPGRFALHADMPPGGGAGASTAALVALARAAGQGADTAETAEMDPLRLSAACLAVEGASDPLMLRRPDGVLWAPREGRIVTPIAPLPPAEVVGGFWAEPILTDPADLDFPDIGDLLAALAQVATLDHLAAIATQSALRCSALRGPADDPTPGLAAALGALGHLRAHTGSARGLIFAPGAVPDRAQPALRAAGFRHVVQFRTGGAA